MGLGLGKSPREILEFYVEFGPKIFRPFISKLDIIRWTKNKYNSRGLQEALKTCFGSDKLGDSNKRLVINSYNIDENDVYLFKTPHHGDLRRDYKLPVWKVAMATSAAPTYFPVFKSIDTMRLVDGGVWANNPSLIGVAEATSNLGQTLDSIKVLSLGTTRPVKKRPRSLDKGGIIAWAIGEHGIEIIQQGQSVGVYKQTQCLVGKGRVLRLDPDVPDGLFKLDKMNTEKLIARAAYKSREYSPEFYHQFCVNKVSEYIPEYKEHE